MRSDREVTTYRGPTGISPSLEAHPLADLADLYPMLGLGSKDLLYRWNRALLVLTAMSRCYPQETQMPRQSPQSPQSPKAPATPKSGAARTAKVTPAAASPTPPDVPAKARTGRTAARSGHEPGAQRALKDALSLPLPSTVTQPPRGKLGQVITLIERDGGASLDDLMAATGWQAHSVRGALSTLKKRLGRPLDSSLRADGQRCYQLGNA